MHNQNFVEINLETIANNVTDIIQKCPEYDYYIGVVKGNAYGHGFGIVPTLIKNGINYLAVSSLAEALAVREIDNQIPILIMEPVTLAELTVCTRHNFAITISNFEYFTQIQIRRTEQNWQLKVHIKLDTGLNRLGVDDRVKFETMYHEISNWAEFSLEGVFTHLATTGINDDLFDRQIAKFLELTTNIDLTTIPIVHLGRSATLETRAKLVFANGIRLGAILYGINQTFRPYTGFKGKLRKIRDDYQKKKLVISPTYTASKLDVATAFALKTPVMEINRVYAGETVGYGGTFTAVNDTLIAVCPIGYADGLHLGLRNAHVAFGEKLFPIVGIINMCMITVNVDETVKVGDFLTVMGGGVSLKKNAQLTNTTPYVGMTQVNPLIKRVYLESEVKNNG